jgi:hypothetical protein
MKQNSWFLRIQSHEKKTDGQTNVAAYHIGWKQVQFDSH